MMLVVPSRTTQPRAACTSAGRPAASPMTRQLTPAERRTSCAPASSVPRSAVRYPLTTARISRSESWATWRTSSICPAASWSRQRRGELALDGYQGQFPAEHVVQVAGEAQPLLGDRQAGVRGPGPVELGHDPQRPRGRAAGENGDADD